MVADTAATFMRLRGNRYREPTAKQLLLKSKASTYSVCPLAKILLSLVIPAYNEAARLGSTLGQVLPYLAAQPYLSEVLLVDDGSADDTAAVAQRYFATHQCPRVAMRVLSYQPNRGKGYAVRQGLLAAQGEVAVFSDADLSTPIAELPRLLAPLLAGHYDVVFGSRAINRAVIGVHQRWLREQSGRVFNRIMRRLTGLPYADTQCGFKAFRLAAVRPLVQAAVLDGFGFDVELLYLAAHAGLRLQELPVAWNNVAGSKVSMRSGLHSFWEVWQVRQLARGGAYAAVLAPKAAAAT